MYKRYFKRLLDFIISILGLLILSPVLILVWMLLYFSNNGKVFFIQERPGLNTKIFKIIKFKSMNDKVDDKGNLLSDDLRLTFIGTFVRRFSVDEIPQLINVLMGDMSLIGPRPLLIEYLDLYNDYQMQRHKVKPGITGWAQVNGRNEISWARKFELDIYYVENISFFMDLKIILLTVKNVFKRVGISSKTSVTMEKFKGNNK